MSPKARESAFWESREGGLPLPTYVSSLCFLPPCHSGTYMSPYFKKICKALCDLPVSFSPPDADYSALLTPRLCTQTALPPAHGPLHTCFLLPGMSFTYVSDNKLGLRDSGDSPFEQKLAGAAWLQRGTPSVLSPIPSVVI